MSEMTSEIFDNSNSDFDYTNKILLADDDLFIRSLVTKMVEPYVEVVTMTNAYGILDAYQDEMPGVVMLDIHLPGRSGLKLVKDILKFDPLAYIYIISADATLDNVVASKERGAKGFISKPFQKDKLVTMLKECPYIDTIR